MQGLLGRCHSTSKHRRCLLSCSRQVTVPLRLRRCLAKLLCSTPLSRLQQHLRRLGGPPLERRH